ncbi:ATP-grasp domain-containing protein [Kitasatospora azatica]|uniref:ATP-grasp domain-containing protein n=1 Tax=Kitasatospora azatica TaxID=58347 RepID=UPI0005608C7C|nr:ATP-grasp domain-containing protein [Kitasatospora azatica]
MSELPPLDGLDVVLAMRQGLLTRHDHVETMFRLGLAVHLVTEDAGAQQDPRYASVRLLPSGSATGALLDAVKDVLHQRDAAFAVTFQETDIEAVGEANAARGVSWSRPVADATARDKARQRAHFAAAGLPTPGHWAIGDRQLTAGLPEVGYPCVVKPTRGASSSHVELVADAAGALRVLAEIRTLAASGQNHFYDQLDDSWALLEEFLPGEEVTCDGVVVDGEFQLGGIHSKVLSPPPFFEEDLYTLPGVDQATEEELTAVMRRLSRSLDLETCLLNAEFRKDTEGRFRLVEFSTRISGGHVYRNIRDAHRIDLVEAFLLAAAGRSAAARAAAARRTPARLATCIRFVYRSGTVAANQVGEAWRHPGFRAYYALAAPGDRIGHAPEGFDICGLLSVWSTPDPAGHPIGIHQLAAEVEALLDIRVD